MVEYPLSRAAGDPAAASGGGDMSPYQFGTLWQEITNGIAAVAASVVDAAAVKERTSQIRELVSLETVSEMLSSGSRTFQSMTARRAASESGARLAGLVPLVILGAVLLYVVVKRVGGKKG